MENTFKWPFINIKRIRKFILIILIIIFSIHFQLLKNINKIKGKIYPLSKLSDLKKKLRLSIEFIKTYSILFYASQKGLTKKPINSFKKKKPVHITHKKGVGICSIGKKENLYAKEFVDYYIKLGIKKIIIYDDNEINGEKFEDVLKEYIIKGKVEIIDIHEFESAQFPSYNDCYKRYGNQFDFLLFLDFDEFVKIEKNIDINTYLYNKKFEKCETIILNWIIYGDNNLIRYDNRSLLERFTKPSVKMKTGNWGKCIVRTKISRLIITSTLIIGINTKYFCDSNGNRIFPKSFEHFVPPKEPVAYIKHFYTKTAEEFCNKINKGDGIYHKSHPERLNVFKKRINMFFIYNSITDEKIKIIENCSGMNLSKLKNSY